MVSPHVAGGEICGKNHRISIPGSYVLYGGRVEVAFLKT